MKFAAAVADDFVVVVIIIVDLRVDAGVVDIYIYTYMFTVGPNANTDEMGTTHGKLGTSSITIFVSYHQVFRQFLVLMQNLRSLGDKDILQTSGKVAKMCC